jgi:hypothetical protein
MLHKDGIKRFLTAAIILAFQDANVEPDPDSATYEEDLENRKSAVTFLSDKGRLQRFIDFIGYNVLVEDLHIEDRIVAFPSVEGEALSAYNRSRRRRRRRQ